jgi:hypothetical protein
MVLTTISNLRARTFDLLLSRGLILNCRRRCSRAADWQAAMEALILVATSGGPTMFAGIGIMRALNRHVERVFNPDRKDHLWGRRKLARDR